jgi:transposase-like protein
LPEDAHASVKRALKDAWSASDTDLARKQLARLASSLQAKHPGAAASVREGLDETLTVQALGITGSLYRTLRTTNPIENLNSSVARYCRNVKRWAHIPHIEFVNRTEFPSHGGGWRQVLST